MKSFHHLKLLFLLGFTALALGLNSCGNQSNPTLAEKKDQLALLKNEKTELDKKIQLLEAEIAQIDTTAASEQKVKTVAINPVQTAVFRHFVSVQGQLEAEDDVMVTSKMPGMVTSIRVKEGDLVKQGQVLAMLDDEVLRKSIEEVKIGLDQINILYNKQKQLWDQKIGTEVQFLQLKNQKEGLEKKLETLKSQLGQSLVTAPFSGVIDAVYIKSGSMASPGIPLMQLVNTQNLKATAKVPDSYVAYIKTGDKVNLEFPDLKKTVEASVSYVGRVVDPVSRTFKIEVKLSALSQELKPNLLALVHINDKTIDKAVVIDENIVQATETGKIVFVAEEQNGKKIARQKLVSTGLSYRGKVEIVSGLQPGDQLITVGFQDLYENQPIRF